MDTVTLATELLHELKKSSQRWFIAFCIMVGVEILTIAGFLWYISLPVETLTTEYSQNAEDVDGSSEVKQMINEK